MSYSDSIQNLFDRLESANDVLRSARREADEARKIETQAINDVNELQGMVNQCLAELRSSAPAGTDWNNRMRGVE